MSSKIIIADDHPLLRTAVRQTVEKLWPHHAIIEVATLAAANEAAHEYAASGNVELLLLDLHMQDSHGLMGLLDFRQNYPAMPVVIMSATEEQKIWRAIKNLGASGFIPKSSTLERMQEALAAVQAGDIWFPEEMRLSDSDDGQEDLQRLATLTPSQRRILTLVNQGLLNKQIAHEMNISEATVKAHITGILRRLGVNNRTQAAIIAQKLEVGIIETHL